MLIRCGLLLLFLTCVRTTTNNFYENELVGSNDRIFSYSFWPSMHNGVKMMKFRKREAQNIGVMVEDDDVKRQVNGSSTTPLPANTPNITTTPKTITTVKPDSSQGNEPTDSIQNKTTRIGNLSKVNSSVDAHSSENGMGSANSSVLIPPVVGNDTKLNETVTKSTAMDLNNPGVLTRALIVFGGFALMAVAYFIFYKRKGKNNDTGSTMGLNDTHQFRYGMLHSDDRRDNLELSRVPLTLESDEEEEDDLEIFDLEQKKKSLSYVNLQTNDEDIVFSNSPENLRGNDRDNLLLDIEDASGDTLINWSSNGNKSIL